MLIPNIDAAAADNDSKRVYPQMFSPSVNSLNMMRMIENGCGPNCEMVLECTGYLDLEGNKKPVISSKHSHLQAQNYSIEDKRYE